jgi:predicted dehydrogenase
LLGTGATAVYALIAPARETGAAEIFAVAARDQDRAAAYARIHGIPHVLESYDALIADPRIDAIYNALPPARRAELTVRALKAGKHVLSEKPFCTTADEAREMVAAAADSGVLLVEGFHYRHHPLFACALKIVREGTLGTVKRIAMHFEAPVIETPTEIRYRPELGGGVLLDMGTYCMHICRSIADQEPVIRSAEMRFGSTGVDTRMHTLFDFPSGAAGEILCDMTAGAKLELCIEGDRGTLVMRNPAAPRSGQTSDLDGAREIVGVEPTFNRQLRLFVAAVRGDPRDLPTGADCIAQMEALDAIRRMALATISS